MLKLTEDTKGFVKSNLESIYSTRSWEEMDQTRNQALQDYMAGVTDTLTPAQSPATPQITHTDFNPYDTQQEVLSRLSLLDENLNPTSTYTDYIKQGGTPVPGYESSHQTLLFLDQVNEKTTQLSRGQITEDQLLWDLYAPDILETQGYKTRSVGWWQSKFSNNDFTNPLTNRYLQNQVLTQAREYHNSLMVQQYAKTKTVADSRLSTLLNKGDLDNEDIATLFPELAKAIKETQQDTDYQSYITSGRVSAQQRIYQSEQGTYYYLHTDGELYKLSNTEKGPKIASFTQSDDGSFSSISINQNDIIDLAQAAKAGAVSTITSTMKLGVFLYQLISGDQQALQNFDSVLNDDWAWATDQRYIDLDGFQLTDLKDWGMFLSHTAGAMFAGAKLGRLAGNIVQWGNTLQTTHPLAGRLVSWGASLYQRSTGLYKGAGTGYYKGPIANLLHVPTNWLPVYNNAKTIGVYMAKDFMNTTSSLYAERIQRQLQDYQNSPDTYSKDNYATDKDILTAAWHVTLINGAISTLLAGGMDDNQTQRWAAFLTPRKTIAHPENLSSFLNPVSNTAIAFNTVADFMDNFLTNYTTSKVSLDKDGKVHEFALSDLNVFDPDNRELAIRTLAQATIQTLPTLSKQLQRRNVAAEEAENLHKTFLKELDLQEQKHPDKAQTLQTIRLNYIEDMKQGAPNQDDQTQADKILYALSRVHENLKTPQNESIATRVLKDVCDPRIIQIYQNMNQLANETYEEISKTQKELPNHLPQEGLRNWFKVELRKKISNNLTSRAAVENYKASKDYPDLLADRLTTEYLTSTGSKESTDAHEAILQHLTNISRIVDVTDTSFTKPEDMDPAQLTAAAQRQASILGIEDAKDIISSTMFIRLKNETEDRDAYNSQRASLFLAKNVLPHAVYQIDDNNFGMVALGNDISKLFTQDSYAKLNVAMYAAANDMVEEGVDLYLKTALGDNNPVTNLPISEGKKMVEDYLNAAIDSHVLTKQQAAEFLIRLRDKNTPLSAELNRLFNIELTTKDVTNKDMTPIERYTLMYRGAMHMQNPKEKRFSGATIAAETLLNSQDKEAMEVLADIVKLPNINPDFQKLYYDALKDYSQEKVFNQAANRFVKDVVEVIGQAGITDIPDRDTTETFLRAIVDNKAQPKVIRERAQHLLNFGKTLNTFHSVEFDGNTVTFDLSSYMTKSTRDFIREVSNTDPLAVKTREDKGTYSDLPPDYQAKRFLDTSTELVDKNRGMVTLELNDNNLEEIKYYFDIMQKADMFSDYVTEPPKTAEDFKKYLQNNLTPIGENFVKYKKGSEYISNIISDKQAKEIQEKLKNVTFDNTYTRFKELHPDDKYIAEYDYYTLMRNNIEMKNISSSLSAQRYKDNAHSVIINPVKLGTEKDGVVTAFIKVPTGVKTKQGRTASKAGEQYAAINTSAKAYNVNKDLALKLMINDYIDYIYDDLGGVIDVVINDKQYGDLFDKGLIDTDSAFYKAQIAPSDNILRLRLSKSKSVMKEYVETNKEINLYKILPFYNSDIANTSIKFNTSQLDNIELPDVQGRGLTTYSNINNILNKTFEFDMGNRLKTQLLTEMFAAKDLNYNPFSKDNIILDMEKLKPLVDSYIKDNNIEDFDGDYYKFYRDYMPLAENIDDMYMVIKETYDQLENNYINDESNDDSKAWLTEPNVLKKMILAAKDESFTMSQDFINDIKKTYKDSFDARDLTPYQEVSLSSPDFVVGTSYGVPNNISNVDTVMSKALLDYDTGTHYRLVDDNGNYTVPTLQDNSIVDAFNYVKDNIYRFDDVNNIISNSLKRDTKSFRIYEPSEVLRLAAITGETGNQISIEDIDTLSRLEMKAYIDYYDNILGMKGMGEQVFDKVITLKDQLLKFVDNSDIQATVRKTRIKQTLNLYNTNFEEAGNIPVGTSGNKKEIGRYLLNNYIDVGTDDFKVKSTQDRLIDYVANQYKKLTEDYTRENSDKDLYKKAWQEHIGEVAVYDNADVSGNTLINDINSDIYLSKKLNSTRNTKASIDNIIEGLNKPTKDIEENIIKYTTRLVDRATGTQMLGTWAKYSFLNPDTGKEIAMATIDKNGAAPNHLDLFDVVYKKDKTLIGSVFIDLAKHDPDSMNGLDYKYKVIKDEQDLSDLKTNLLLEVIDENKWLSNKYKTTSDIVYKMSKRELNDFINKAKQNNLTNVAKTRALRNKLEETNIDKPWLAMLKPQNFRNGSMKNYIADHYNSATPARFDSDPQVRLMYNATLFGIDYDSMDDVRKDLYNKVAIDLIDVYNKKNSENKYTTNDGIMHFMHEANNREMTSKDWEYLRNQYGIKKDSTIDDYTNMAYKFIIDSSKTPETLSYLFNKHKALNTMYKESKNKNIDSYTLSDGSKLGINDLNNFFSDDTKSSIHKAELFDCEGSNITRADGTKGSSIRDLFQISVLIYNKDENGLLHEEQITKFIKHDITPEEWVRQNINKKDQFYKDNKAYKEAVDAYLNTSTNDMLSYEEVKDILTGRLTGTPDVVIAYNGNNYEFKLLADQLEGVKTLDAIDTVLKGYGDTTQKLDQDSVYKRSFSTDHGEKHSADEDVRDMAQIIKNMVSTELNLNEDRYRLVNNLNNLLNLDEKDLTKVLVRVNSMIRESDELSKAYKEFNHYEPSLDNIKQLQRMFNYLQNNMDGKAMFELMKDLDYKNIEAQFVRNNRDNPVNASNALDIIAVKMLDTEGDFSKAFHEITNVIFDNENADVFDDKSYKKFLELIGSKNETLLEKAGVDLSLLDNEQVQEYRRNLQTSFSGFKDKNKYINLEEQQRYEDNFLDIPLSTGAQSALINNRDYIPQDVYNNLKNLFSYDMLTLEEDVPFEEIKDFLNTTITYDQSHVEQLVNQIKNVLGPVTGTGTFRGLYLMSVGLDPQHNDVKEVEYNNGRLKYSGKSLDNVGSLEMAVSLYTLKNKFGITDLSEIEASDGNLYLCSVTNPADNMNPILPLRVRIVQDEGEYIGFTPETQEILRNRDFDGDHSLTSKLSKDSLEIAKEINKYLGAPSNVISRIGSLLRVKQRGSSTEESAILRIGMTNRTIIDECRKLDKVLEKYKGDLTLTKEANEEIETINNKIFDTLIKDPNFKKMAIRSSLTDLDKLKEKAIKLLGVRTSYDNSSDTNRYVNNPALYKEGTYTYNSRLGSIARQQLKKTNIQDSTIGTYQKILSVINSDIIDVENPMHDLYTPNYYLTSDIEDGIRNNVTTKHEFESYLRNLKTYLTDEINNNIYKQSTVDYYKDFMDVRMTSELLDVGDNTDFAERAIRTTLESLWDLDMFIQNQAESKADLTAALKTLSEDDTFKDNLNTTLDLEEKLKQLGHLRKKINTKRLPYSPYTDLLSQDIVMNRANALDKNNRYSTYNYGGELYDLSKEDFLDRRLDNINNGFNTVNIFMTSGFTPDSDTIMFNPKSSAHAISIEVLNKDTGNYNLKPGDYVKAGKAIGTDADGNTLVSTRPFYVVSTEGNSITINTDSTLIGKKISSLGMAKGNTIEGKVFDMQGNPLGNEVSFVVDINNAFKNPDKLPVGFDSDKYFDNVEYTRFKDSSGKEYWGWLFKDVPFNIIGSSSNYKASVNVDDPSSIRHYEMMTLDGAKTLASIMRFGSSALYTDEQGNLHVDDNYIKNVAKETGFGNYDLSYKDWGAEVMYQRASMLLSKMTDEEFLGMVNKVNNGKCPFESKEDYLANLRKSTKVNSEAAYNEQLDMIRTLGKDKYYDLVNSCDLAQFIFGGEINSQLNKLIPSSFTAEFFENPRSARSKTSGAWDFSNEEKTVVNGKVINESQRGASLSNITTENFLHVPANVYYRGVTGRNVDSNSVIRLYLKDNLDIARHYKNSANIGNDFYPVDMERGIRTEDVIGPYATASGPKTSHEGVPDIEVTENLDAGKWLKGQELNDIINVRDDPYGSSFYSTLSKTQEQDRPTSGFTWQTRFSHDLGLALDKHKTNLEKYAYLKGIDRVDIGKINFQLMNDADKMYYKASVAPNVVPVKDAMKTINANTKGYAIRNDLGDFLSDVEVSKEDQNNLKNHLNNIRQDNIESYKYNENKKAIYRKAAALLRTPKSDYSNYTPKFTWDTSTNEIEWKSNPWTRSGIDDKGAEQLSVDIGIKNMKANIPYLVQQYSEPLNKLKAYSSQLGTKEFEDFCKYNFIMKATEYSSPQYTEHLKSIMGINSTEDFNKLYKAYNNFEAEYPEIVKEYNNHINNMLQLSKMASNVTNEPFTHDYIFMMPFVSNNKELRENQVYSTIKNMASISKYDPTIHENLIQQNMTFNFFEGSEKLIKDLANTVSSSHISDALLGKYNGKALMDNIPIIDEAYKIITDTDAILKMKPYTSFDSEITQKVLDAISMYTDINVKNLRKNSKDPRQLLTNTYQSILNDVDYMQEGMEETVGKKLTLSEAYRIGFGDMASSYSEETAKEARDLYNYMHAQIIVAQRIMEADNYSSSKLNGYIESLYESGKVLVNKFGQKIERNGIVAPTNSNSFGYLKDNVEIAMNSRTKEMFNQYVLEKALSGELYIMDKGLADQLEQHVWTAKVPNRVKQALTKSSKFFASIQMAMPAKLLGRIMRFTGTDYAMGTISNPEVVTNIPRAARELSAALMSKGNNITDNLKDYLMREGQPELWGSGVDPLDPTITTDWITKKLTAPLDFQNHLGRYAIYLTAKDSFDNGTPWYGSQYYNHEAIDAIRDNRDKAMYVMDYMLGSPGGFPDLSKKTSGYLMYTTFPLNFTRTLGSYGMSLAKLFQEGITEENKTQWYNNVVTPSLGMTGLAMLSNLIITAVCDYYDVDEEKEEEWKREGVTLDPLGTLIGGTPSVVYDSINPAFLAKEMFINPFTNEYNDTLPKKGYGWMKANVLSSLNPLIKTPIELVTGKDLYGDNAEGYKNAQGLFENSNKYQYTNIENGMKKVMGFLVGSGVANSIVDQFKIDSNDKDSSFTNTLAKGFTKGFMSDLGNQKSWKNNTSNYYSIITDMKNYAKQSRDTYGNTYGNAYYYDIDDLADADKLEYSRKYSGRYGEFNQDDYNRVNGMLKKMIQNHTDATTLYAYIVKEYNENKVSEATLRSALNNNSIIRKLRLSSMSGYKDTLNESELRRLQKAIDYENEYYPILQYLFPDKESTSKAYIPSYKKDYLGSGSGTPSSSRPYTPYNRYYPGKYYPSTYKFNKKTGRYGVNLERVKVNVSPQMAIWNQDKNLTQYQTGLDKTNDPRWLRSRDYTSRVYNI